MRCLPSRKLLLIAGAAGFALTFANQPSAEAATDTEDLTVQATVLSACTVATSVLDLGSYDSLNANAATGVDKDESLPGTVIVTCADGLPFSLNLGSGLNFSGGLRHMENQAVAGELLSYTLHNGAASGGSPVWPAAGLSGTGGGAAAPDIFTIGGRAPRGQSPQAGDYQDTVVATVTF